MLTFIEAISLAGDRAKQNDDAFGFSGARAWVIDGATDLHDAPLTGWASDASWIANVANAQLWDAGADLRSAVRNASAVAAQAFQKCTSGRSYERWQSPIASLLMVEATAFGVEGLDLGDCRIFALESDGDVHLAGGTDDAADAESALAARQSDADKPLLQRTQTMEVLRRMRAGLNRDGARWTFGLDPACADHSRVWAVKLARPAHLLLMTDGFSALTDRYRRYDAATLVRYAVEKGLQELGRDLRAVEDEDARSVKHPRFKKNDDATALLLRLT
jgi:Protein phosphatase 2C